MPILGLRGRTMATAIVASAAALIAVLLLVGPTLRRRTVESTRTLLFAEARLMARAIEPGLVQGTAPQELDRLIDEEARQVQSRFTLIAPDGRVLADSVVSGADLARMENHAGRPEVQQALNTGTGTALRPSTTTGHEMLYAAVVVRNAGKTLAVLRAAQALHGVEAQARDLRNAVGLALLLAFAITVALSAVFASPLAGPLKEIMETARRLSSGDLTARIRIRRNDELGELGRILNLSADRLQERLAENAREQARIEAILSSMEDGVLAVDHRGTVLLANEALRRSLELQGPAGRHYLEVIRQAEVGDLIREVLETGSRRTTEVEIHRLRRTYSLSGVSFPGAEGVPTGAVVTFDDITERRRLDRVRRDFVANASHELRTPLTSIRGFVEALEDGAMSEPANAERFLGKIRTHADRMATLVEDLLELSRLESGERPPRLEQVVSTEMVGEVVASFSGVAQRKGTVLVGTDHGAPTLMTDGERLRRILENLVDNALKYTPDGGRVELVTGEAPGGGAQFEVRDNGPGIAPEHLPRLFERFYRVDKARSREMGGTGLGLAIVKHLSEGIGATVTVASELGKGSTFTVLVPGGEQA